MNSSRWRLLVAFAVALSTAAWLRSEARDLGGGLTFVRLHTLAEPVPEASGIVVLDVRYATLPPSGDPSALREFLRAQRSLRLVLHDANPPEALAAILAERDASVITVAPANATPAADVAVTIDAAADRAAYDALETGAELTALADPALNKRRFDEAALVRARNRRGESTAGTAAAAPASTPPAEAAAPEATPAASAPPVDALLQHAIRIARGLQALGRA